MLSARDVADYFLGCVKMHEDDGEVISNLKLQKLVYYAQGFHLAIYGKPLFPEGVKAWKHGPVVPELYQDFKTYGGRHIDLPESVDLSQYDDQTRELLDEIYEVYGQFSAWQLRNITHKEPPWADTTQNLEISHNAMKQYFKTQLVDGEEAED